MNKMITKQYRNSQDLAASIVAETEYGRNHTVNGLWHPLGTWTEMPASEQVKLDEPKSVEYQMQDYLFEKDQRTYNELCLEVKNNPDRWFECVPQGYGRPKGGRPFVVLLRRLPFQVTLSEAEVNSLTEYPKGERVCKSLAVPQLPFGIGESSPVPWGEDWRAQLCINGSGVLQVASLRVMPKLCSEIDYPGINYPGTKTARAIADESPDGDYIVRIRRVNYISHEIDRRNYLLLTLEVLSGQARGFLGEILLDGTDNNLRELETALGIKRGMWCSIVMDPVGLPWAYFKARLDLSGEYPKLENPRKVEEKEVAYWL